MLGLFLKILLTTWSFFFQFPRTKKKSHLESHMESHLLLAVCSLEITQNQVKDQSKQIERLISLFNDQSQQLNDQLQQLNDQSQRLNNQSQQIKGLVAKNTEQSQEIASLTSSMQGLVQKVERLTGQDRHQAVLVDKPTNQTKGMTNKIKANIDKVEEGKFLKKLWRCVNGGYSKISWFYQLS